MKKNSLFKFLGILLLIVLVLTYIIPGRSDTMNYLGLGDLFLNYLQSFYYFFDTALFILVVGGFYGLLNKTGAYKKLLDMIVTKVKPKSNKFIFLTVIIFAVLESLTGMTVNLLVFVPFVVSIILLLGYDKLVAITSTIGAILIGFIGGIFVTLRDPSNMYGVSYVSFEKLVGLDTNFVNVFPKLLLLLAGLALLIYYINSHIKNVEAKKVKYELNGNTDILIAEVKGNYKDLKVWPLVTVLALILILLILGFFPFESLFGVTVFNDFHTWLTGLTIKKFEVWNNIISANFPAFGNWASLGSYMMTMIILILFALIIKIVYKIKLSDALEGFTDGMKKMLPTVCLVILAYSILVSAYNNGFMETIITKAGDFNLGITSLVTLLGSLLNVDLYYTASSTFLPLVNAFSDSANLELVAILFQSLYGFISIIGPTSLLLIIGLSYLDVPYTTWLKYIWRFALYLFILIFIVALIVILV